MRAVLLREIGVVELVDVDDPVPGDSEVVVEVALSGVCGSDVHSARDGGLLRTPPIVMGHEFSALLGERRVTVNPMISCDACDSCSRGQDHLCRNRRIIGIQRPGAFAARVAVPERSLVDIPAHVSMEAAAMIEPLAVALHAVRLCEPGSGDRVAIIGAGTIGLLVAYLCASLSERVSVVDLDPTRLLLARGLGVDDARQFLEGEYDVVFDAAGTEVTHRLSLQHLRPGGTAVWVGNESPESAFDAQMLVRIEQRVIGSAAYGRDDFQSAAGLIDDRVLEWATIRPLHEGPATIYELMEPRPGGPVKVLLRP